MAAKRSQVSFSGYYFGYYCHGKLGIEAPRIRYLYNNQFPQLRAIIFLSQRLDTLLLSAHRHHLPRSLFSTLLLNFKAFCLTLLRV